MREADRLGAPERFVSRPYALKTSMAGAAMGTFDPGTIAQRELGELHWGAALGYMLRRFGPPNVGSDPYKEICSWMISTPMEDVALTVRITPSSTGLLFGYMLTRELDEDLMQLKYERRIGWQARFGTWCTATHGREPTSWAHAHLPYTGEGSPTQQEKAAAREEFDAWRAAFDDQDVGDPNADDDRLVRAEDALTRTIRDLRRTVSVRDQDISIHGVSQRFRHVAYDANAGVAPPAYTRDDEMWRVYAAVHRLGGGRKGLARLVEIVEREVPPPA